MKYVIKRKCVGNMDFFLFTFTTLKYIIIFVYEYTTWLNIVYAVVGSVYKKDSVCYNVGRELNFGAENIE